MKYEKLKTDFSVNNISTMAKIMSLEITLKILQEVIEQKNSYIKELIARIEQLESEK